MLKKIPLTAPGSRKMLTSTNVHYTARPLLYSMYGVFVSYGRKGGGQWGGEPILDRAASHFPRLRPSSGRGSPVHCPTGGGEPLAEWRGKWNMALWRLHSLSHGTQLAAPPPTHSDRVQVPGLTWATVVVAVRCGTVVLLFGLTSQRGSRKRETNTDHFFHPSLINAFFICSGSNSGIYCCDLG